MPNRTRTVSAILVTAIIASPVVASASPVGASSDTQSSLSIELTTTEGDENVTAIAEGQPVEVEVLYSNLGEGDHEVSIVDDDLLSDTELKTFTVSGSSGSKTVTISGETMNEKLGDDVETSPDILARTGRLESDQHNPTWVEQTTYVKDVPQRVEANEEVTVTFYGWTANPTAPVSLMEDDPPERRGLGEDEQIRHQEVQATDNYFEGTLTFTPSEYITEGEDTDRILELHARGTSVVEDVITISPVKTIEVSEPATTTTTATTATTTTEATTSPNATTGTPTQATENQETGQATTQAEHQQTVSGNNGESNSDEQENTQSSGLRDSDGDGVVDQEDYAPNDEDVQQKSDLNQIENVEANPTTIGLVLLIVGALLVSARWFS